MKRSAIIVLLVFPLHALGQDVGFSMDGSASFIHPNKIDFSQQLIGVEKNSFSLSGSKDFKKRIDLETNQRQALVEKMMVPQNSTGVEYVTAGEMNSLLEIVEKEELEGLLEEDQLLIEKELHESMLRYYSGEVENRKHPILMGKIPEAIHDGWPFDTIATKETEIYSVIPLEVVNLYSENQCSKAIERLVSLEIEYDLRSNYSYLLVEGVNALEESKKAAYAAARAEYSKACTKEISVYSNDIQAQLSKSVGFFISNNSGTVEPFCSGAFIKNKTVLTARHCFFNYDGGVALFSANGLESVRFATVGMFRSNGEKFDADLWGKSYLVGENIYAAAGKLFSNYEDYLLVPLVETTQIGYEHSGNPVQTASPEKYKKLILVGPNTLLADDALGVGLKTDVSPYCSVVLPENQHFLERGCIWHGCQTSQSYSGSPLFQISATNKLELVGIHLADGDTPGNCQRDDKNLNFGLSIAGTYVSLR